MTAAFDRIAQCFASDTASQMCLQIGIDLPAACLSGVAESLAVIAVHAAIIRATSSENPESPQ